MIDSKQDSDFLCDDFLVDCVLDYLEDVVTRKAACRCTFQMYGGTVGVIP